MATVELIPGKGTCQHVQVKITIDKETRSYSLLREELNSEQDVDRQFDAVLVNLKTNIKLSGTTDYSVLAASMTGREFMV
jgi:hypothetical protein